MAIFDSTKKMYLSFNVVLTDAAQVAALNAANTPPPSPIPGRPTRPAGVNAAPLAAAVTYAAPFRGFEAPAAGLAPFTWTPWSGQAEEDGPFPLNVANFERHTGGFWGIGGETVKYYWMGKFVLAADAAGDPSVPPGEQGELMRRRWVEGFETPGQSLPGNIPAAFFSVDASRHVGGRGLAIRGFANLTINATIDAYTGGLTATKSWERFYLRLRNFPAATVQFWRTDTYPSSLVGQILGITGTGQIALFTSNAVNAQVLVAVVPEALELWSGRADHNAWVKIDCLIEMGQAPAPGTFRLYVNGVLKITGGGVNGTLSRHVGTKMGGMNAVANTLYLDVDDWINADIPRRDVDGAGPDLAVEALTSKDWINGTKIALVRPTGFNGSHSASWVGDFRALLQQLLSLLPFTPAALTTSTASALCVVDTDAAAVADADPGAIGVAAFLVAALTEKWTANGKLGYQLGAAAAVDNAVTQTLSLGAQGVMFSAQTASAVDVAPAFPVITPLTLRHTKGADAGAAAIKSLLAQVELVGKWGPEDGAGDTTGSPGAHNTPYPRSPWAQIGVAAPIAPYIVVGGTYVGNGLGQDLTFRAPPHWVFVRPLTGNTGGYLWWSGMAGSHSGFQQGISSQIADAQEDPTFVNAPGADTQTQRYRIRIAGANTQLNAVGVTYQYIAVCDPGSRFMLNAVLNNAPTMGPRTHELIDPGFLPGWAFVFPEEASTATTKRLYGKGPGQAAASLVAYAPATLANALTFQAGALDTDVALHALAGGNTAVSLWRAADGTQDTGQAAAVNFGSYTGDGSASRTVNLTPASGKRPLFMMVFAASGTVGQHRDPSHTTTNSSTHAGTQTATGITSGGIDQFSVGAPLNGAGIVYSYFVLFGNAVACNGGFSCNGEFVPVEPTMPDSGPYPPDPDPDGYGAPPPGGWTGTPETIPSPCPPENPDCAGPEIAAACVAGSTALVNRALGRIGVTKQVVALGTDPGVEATLALLNYGFEINQTLRDFPWPCATKFTQLPTVGGTSAAPVNAEWQYSYRRPGDCVFERRLCSTRGGAVDPTPPAFELGTDALGGLIYTNQANAYLEYTARPLCAAAVTDPLFREALTWRMAAALATALTRMPDRAKECMAHYAETLVQAEAVLRPGKPGPALAASADPDLAVKLTVVNRALIRIGARTIASYGADQSKEAQAARLVFAEEYLGILTDHPWAFATSYVAPSAPTGGTASIAINGDWQYSYALPADFVAMRRLVTAGVGRGWDPAPTRYRMGHSLTASLLFTDDPTPVIEYTSLASIAGADALFRDALAWRIAAALAPSLAQTGTDITEQTGRGPEPNVHTEPGRTRERQDRRDQARRQIATAATQMYWEILRRAHVRDANSQQQAPAGDVDWITGRQ